MRRKRKTLKRMGSMTLAMLMCVGVVPVNTLAEMQDSKNVILNCPATVTGTEINTRPDMTLDKVNDGKMDTRVSTVGQYDEDIVFEFALDGAKLIDRAEIFERCDRQYGDAPRIDEVTVQVLDGTEWKSVSNAVKTSQNEGNELEHITVTFDPIVANGTVRIITKDREKQNPTIWEMEVYGTDTEGPASHNISYNLEHLSGNGPEKIEIGKDLRFTLTADYGYTLPENIKVTTNGEELKGGYIYDKETGEVVVSKVDGDVTITASGVRGETPANGLIRLNKGETADIATSFQDSQTPITWTSGNEEVAVVDANGKVTAMSEGTTVITAAAGNETEYCTVVVDGYMRTWYDEPAKSWERDCLPIGNGNLGGMIYGNTERERIQVNEITLWSKGNNYQGGNVEGAWKNLKPIQDEMFSRLDNNFSGINVNGILGNESGCGAYQSLGDIYFDFDGEARTENPKNYVRELDLDDGFVRVSYENKGVQFTREYMASYPGNVMAFRLTSSKEDALSFKLDYNQGDGRTAVIDKAEENSIIYQGKVNAGGMAFATKLKVVAPDADVTCNSDATISVSNGEDVLILMSAGTNYDITESKNINNISDFYTADGDYLDNDDPNGNIVMSEVTARVNDAAEKGYAELVKAHMEDYQGIMGRVDLDLGDEEKAAMPTDDLLDAYKKERSNYAETVLFQMGRYLLLSSSRDSLPANLQGIWNDSNSPGWNSDYHFNVNLQMNYWPAFVTDMSETAMPLVNYMDSLRNPGNVTAREHFGVEDGWVVNTEANPFGKTAPGSAFSWGFTPGSGAWTCQNLWDYYEFTGNPEVLEKIYPILKEGAEFWLGYMVEDPRTRIEGVEGTGELVTAPGGSSEHGPVGVGTTYDMSLAYMEMQNTAKAAKILGVDEELQTQIQGALSRMKPFWIGTDGQLKEWREETGYSSMPGTERLHRHLSHLLGLHPGNLITKEGSEFSEYYDAAVRALELRDDGSSAVGWSMAQKGNIFARVGDGEKALHHMNLLLTEGLGDNLLDVYVHPSWGDIFQVEANMGYTAGVAEMLLQSHQGFIEPLPALPKAWADGSYTGLVARGNYKTDAVWHDSHLEKFVVRSTNGGECIVRYPNISKATLSGGTFTVIDVDTVKIDTVKGGEYVFENIPVRKSVEEIKVESESGITLLEKAGQSIEVTADVLPEDADNKAVTWKVTDENGGATDCVTIDENGVLTATDKLALQNVKVTATAKDGSDVSGECIISIATDRETKSQNVALNRPVKMTGADIYNNDTMKLTNINDGNLDTRMAVANGGQKTNDIQFDFELENEQKIERVELYEYLDRGWGANGRIDRIEVQIQKDGSWETIAAKDTPDNGEGDGKRCITVEFAPVTATNVRVQVTDNEKTDPTIWELEIYASSDSMPLMDKEALIQRLKETAHLTEKDFVGINNGWETYQNARKEALEVVNDPRAVQKEIDDALDNLNDALKKDGLRTDVLAYLVSIVKDLDTEGVIHSVVEMYQERLAAAEQILKDVESGSISITQKQIDEATWNLLEVVQYFSFKQGNKAELQKVINMAKEIDLDKYLEVGQETFTKALTDAEKTVADGNAMQDEVDTAWKALLKAMSELRLKPDKTVLDNLLKEANAKDAGMYTEESYQVLCTAMAEASAVYADEQADEESVNSAAESLAAAMEGLVAKEEGQKTETNTVVKTISTANVSENKETVKSAKTGDPMDMTLYIALMAMAAVGLGTAVKMSKKRK